MWRFVNIVVFIQTVIQLSSNDYCAAALTPVTRNVAAVAGSSVTFRCKSDRPNPVRWNYRVSTRHSALHTVYNGMKLADAYNVTLRFSVEYVNLVSTLMISNVRLSDGGTYSGVDTTGEQQFELIVLGSDVVCVNENTLQHMPNGSAGASIQQQTTTCSLLYSGNCEPFIHCDQPVSHVSKTCANQSAVTQPVLCNKTIHFAQRFEDNDLRCTTQFLTNCSNNVGPPSYRHAWDYSSIENTSKQTTASLTHTLTSEMKRTLSGKATEIATTDANRSNDRNGRVFTESVLLYGLVIGCLLAVVTTLTIVLVFIILHCRKAHVSSVQANGKTDPQNQTKRYSIRNSYIGNRVSRMYSLVHKRQRLALPTEPTVAEEAECTSGHGELVDDLNIYDDTNANNVPTYNASYSKYANAPDDSSDGESIQPVVELVEAEGTESSHYAELPE